MKSEAGKKSFDVMKWLRETDRVKWTRKVQDSINEEIADMSDDARPAASDAPDDIPGTADAVGRSPAPARAAAGHGSPATARCRGLRFS